MIKNTLMLSILMVNLVAVPAVYAEAPRGPEGEAEEKMFMEKREAKMQQMYQELNLSDEQKRLLEENKNKHREQGKGLYQELRAKKEMVRQELQKPELDMDKITRINNEIKQLQAQMVDHRLEGILEVRKILTPEQFSQFMNKMEERRKEFRQKREDRKSGR